MLTRSKLSDFQVPDVDLEAFARSAGDLATHDLPKLIRKADVPGRFEDGVDAIADAFHTAATHIPGRQPRSPWRPWAPAIVIVAVVAVLGLTAWWMARSSALSAAAEEELDFDQDAVERAASEGMANDGPDQPTMPRA